MRLGRGGALGKLDGKEPSGDGGLAFGERNLFSAEIELRREKVVIADDEKAVVAEQGEAFPFFGQLIPSEALRGEIEVLKIEEEFFLHVLDRLRGVEGFEFWVGLAKRVGLIGQREEVGGTG